VSLSKTVSFYCIIISGVVNLFSLMLFYCYCIYRFYVRTFRRTLLLFVDGWRSNTSVAGLLRSITYDSRLYGFYWNCDDIFRYSLLLYIFLYFAWCDQIYAVYWHRVLARTVRYLQCSFFKSLSVILRYINFSLSNAIRLLFTSVVVNILL